MSICSTANPRKQVALTTTVAEGLKPLAVPALAGFKIIGVKPTKGWNLIKEGRLETVHFGPRCNIVVASMERLIEELREEELARAPRKGLEQATASSLASRKARRARARREPATDARAEPHASAEAAARATAERARAQREPLGAGVQRHTGARRSTA
jgi:hypothetical protein